AGQCVSGVVAADERSGETFRVAARAVVNVAGPWVDEVLTGAAGDFRRLIGGTKGSHLVVDPFPGAPAQALYFEAKADHRPVLIIPWNGRYLIGSTDIRYDGDPDAARVDDAEIAYLLGETNSLIPAADLTAADVRYAYAGVRPLPWRPAGVEGNISRDHAVVRHGAPFRGLFSITGGKLTTYRALAEHAVNDVFRALGRRPGRCPTARVPLPGAAGIVLEPFKTRFVADSGLPERTAERLVDIYGRRAVEVPALAGRDPYLREPFAPNVGAIRAEIVFAFQQEFAATLEDVLLRRTMVGLEPDLGLSAVEAAAETARYCLGWSAGAAAAAVARYHTSVQRFRPEILRALERDPRAEEAAVGADGARLNATIEEQP
ncbi:MAG: FAD-dependent oxidoreductase, partial [Thermomicrobiales bacterium]|nr:FAD-dependent oxidoreductase [Thermomicrobiales bacterium]